MNVGSLRRMPRSRPRTARRAGRRWSTRRRCTARAARSRTSPRPRPGRGTGPGRARRSRSELVLRRRVRVPGDVRLDGVQPHLPGLADPVGPLVGVHPEVVQRAGQDPERLAVEQEVALADGEPGHRGGSPGVRVECRCFLPFLLAAWRARARVAGRGPGRPHGECDGLPRCRQLAGDGEPLLGAVLADCCCQACRPGVEVGLAGVGLADGVGEDAVGVDLERQVAPARAGPTPPPATAPG